MGEPPVPGRRVPVAAALRGAGPWGAARSGWALAAPALSGGSLGTCRPWHGGPQGSQAPSSLAIRKAEPFWGYGSPRLQVRGPGWWAQMVAAVAAGEGITDSPAAYTRLLLIPRQG